MPGPSDYRYEPFSDISSGVTLTERHLIPATSPYVVRLNEVPQKNSPSTMMVKEITDVNGEVITYGSTFDEVAANPSANQFWPDYNTGADGNDNWNTGLLEFNSSDAGKLIEVSYTGTGTLASVKANRYPAWWLDRGDGSDGAFNPTGNTAISGEKNYTSVFIKSGVTVTVNGVAILKTIGSFINNGTITADAQGAAGGSGISEQNPGNPGENGGSANGGAGGAGVYQSGGAGGTIEILGSNNPEAVLNYIPVLVGAGGGGGGGHSNSTSGAGGRGGGEILITAKEFENNGSISANGENGGAASKNAGCGGGGGGGSVIVVADIVIDNGSISANGGTGGTGGYKAGAAGDDGIIRKIELGAI